MRNVQYLIEEIREATENQDVSEFIGIQDREILRYLNDAQERLQSQIAKTSPKVFTKEVVIDVDGSRLYDLPYDIFMGNKITDVKYRYSPQDEWERLEPDFVANLDDLDYYDIRPETYIRLTGQISLRPRPDRGQFRVTYVASVPKLDLERARVQSANISNGELTTLDLVTPADGISELQRNNMLSIVNVHGEILVDNIKFDEISTSTGLVTLTANVPTTLANGSSLVNARVVSGKKASTHSSMDDIVERYIMAYTKMKILQRDGSGELATQQLLVSEMEAEIVESYAVISDDILHIPDINRYFDEF